MFTALDPGTSAQQMIKVVTLHIRESDKHLLYLTLCWRKHTYINTGHLILEIGT